MPLARYTYHAQGEQIHIAQWPTVKTIHQVASRHYAFEGRRFVIAAGTVLHRDEVLATELPLFDQLPVREDGLVIIDQEECIGCGRCIEACPFDAIIMLPEDVAAKCDGCADEVAKGWEPTCVRACPMRALKHEQLDNAQTQNRVPDLDFDDRGIGPAVLYLRRTIG